jgi:hypothetical protein
MRMIRIKRLVPAFLTLVFSLSLLACEATVPPRNFPELTFQHLEPIRLDVASLETVSSYKPPMTAPNVDHMFPTSPLNALSRWVSDRLVASGSGSVARFTIVDAAVRETTLTRKKGFTGAFTKDQSERYDAALEATLEIIDDSGSQKGFASAKVSRSVTVREDASVNDREQAWFNLTEALMKDINGELEKNISQYLANWVK